MCTFIDFWKLETENSLLHVFSFLHKLSLENSFCFLPVLSYQTSFLVLKIENCFWKQKTRGKNSYQTYPKILFHFLCFVFSGSNQGLRFLHKELRTRTQDFANPFNPLTNKNTTNHLNSLSLSQPHSTCGSSLPRQIL